METEIVIFDIPTRDEIVNKSQKELEYDDLKKNTKIPPFHLLNFYEIEQLEETRKIPESNMVSILCNFLLQYCIPIITHDVKDFHVSLQYKSIIEAITKNGAKIAIPNNVQFKVIGIKLPTIFMMRYDINNFAYNNFLNNTDISNGGHFGLYDQYTYKYTQQRENLTKPGFIYNFNDKILFLDNDDTIKKCKELIKYVHFVESYYNQNILTLYLDFKTLPYKPEFMNDGFKSWKIAKSEKYSADVLSEIEKYSNFKFGTSLDMDVEVALDSHHLDKVYNIGKNIGTDSSMFIKNLKKKKEELDNMTEINKQMNEGYVKKLEVIKKQIIAYHKYKITDLDILDQKQLKIIDLEYKKMSNFLQASDKDNKNGQALFYQLRKSFSDVDSERIKETLTKIENLFSDKELEGDDLLSGGLCPHVYHFGKILYKNFGKIQMMIIVRDYMIERYSLPSSAFGYFCKICGEQIAESDTTAIPKFVALKDNIDSEDKLSDLLWKEAVYIITTYVKFTIPVPIKPLINSLVSGLRNKLAEEEIKLIKSKTTTTDNVKDTLNLYASIYIFASLCAIMINNPGKITFGREKPTSQKIINESTEQRQYNEEKEKKNIRKEKCRKYKK